MRKYRLSKITNDRGLRRIVALIDGPWGPAGTRGGWVASEANLSQAGTCWIADDAQVSGEARITDDAQIMDCVRIYGTARVSGRACVSGHALIYGDAYVGGEVRITDAAQVFGAAQVSGQAFVLGAARVYDQAQVSGKAVVRDQSVVFGQARVFETAPILGGAHIGGAARIRQQSDYLVLGPLGPWPKMMTFYRSRGRLRLSYDGFDGSPTAFLADVRLRYGSSPQLEAFTRAIAFAQSLFALSIPASCYGWRAFASQQQG